MTNTPEIVSRMRHYCDKIKDEPRLTIKESWLEEYAHDNAFVKLLQFLYNPMITTGISKKKIEKTVSIDSGAKKLNFLELLEYVEENTTGRDADLIVVNTFISTLENEDDKEFVKQVISKDVKIGITAKTLNKLFLGAEGGKFVFEFSPMLASDFTKRQHKLDGEFVITQKIDGIRCIAIKGKDSTVSLFARSGKEMLGLTEIEKSIMHNDLIPAETILDGELLLSNSEGMSVGETFRNTQKIVRKDGIKTGVDFLVFDTLTLDEFANKGISKLPYSERRNMLEEMLNNSSDVVKALPVLYRGTDKTMITLKADEADAAGFEGVMVNSSEGRYEIKRTDSLMKVKSFKSADLLCTAVVEGTGKHKNKAGAIAVEYKGGITHVGTGFNDADREQFFANNELVVGKIVEVKYFEETTDSTTGQASLRFPVFVGVRDDKGIEDINIE